MRVFLSPKFRALFIYQGLRRPSWKAASHGSRFDRGVRISAWNENVSFLAVGRVVRIPFCSVFRQVYSLGHFLWEVPQTLILHRLEKRGCYPEPRFCALSRGASKNVSFKWPRVCVCVCKFDVCHALVFHFLMLCFSRACFRSASCCGCYSPYMLSSSAQFSSPSYSSRSSYSSPAPWSKASQPWSVSRSSSL